MNFDCAPDDTMGRIGESHVGSFCHTAEESEKFSPSVLHVLLLFMVKFPFSATSTAGFSLKWRNVC